MSLAVAFFDLDDDFLEVLALASAADAAAVGEAAAVSAVSAFLLLVDLDLLVVDAALESALVASADALDFLDFEGLAVEAPLAVSAVAVDFFDFELFVLVEVPAVEASAASAFFDLDDFLVVELSAGAVESVVVDFLDFEDFVVVELSGAAAVSVVVLCFFFFAVVVEGSFGSVDCVVDCAATRKVTFPATRKRAESTARYRVPRVRFIM